MSEENVPKWRNRRNLQRRPRDELGGVSEGQATKVNAMIRQSVGARRVGASRRVCPRPMRWSQARTALSPGNAMQLVFTTEYPQGALPGEAITLFADLIKQSDGLDLCVETKFDAEASVSHLITSDDDEMGCTLLGSTLTEYSPDFALAAMPSGDAPITGKEWEGLRKLFSERLTMLGVHLLAMLPMPPTGLWSAREIDDVSSLKDLRLRSYDTVSRDMFNACGCQTTHLPFAELPTALSAGKLDAVLSSGDGSAGSVLSQHFKHYLHIEYSRPYIFIVVGTAKFELLSDQTKKALEWAGSSVQRHYTLPAVQSRREERNLAAMGERDVKVTRELSPDLGRMLRKKMGEVRTHLLEQHVSGAINDDGD